MSNYLCIREKPDSDCILFVFSHVNVEEGSFSFWKVASAINATIVHVNTSYNGWYHNGVPGVSSNIEETKKHLKLIIQNFKSKRIFTFGASMGGYAAALFGCLLEAERVLMISAESILNLPGSRSNYFGFSDFDSTYLNISNLIKNSLNTEFIWWVGNDGEASN